jgi:pyridinium-3,5-biscarboxylic acid mononucleotide synthase
MGYSATMNSDHIRSLLEGVRSGGLDIEQALDQLRSGSDSVPGVAEVDLDRLRRTGHPEVIFGQGKEAADIVSILERLHGAGQPGLVTRLSEDKAAHILTVMPEAQWHRRARVLHLAVPGHTLSPKVRGTIAIVCAGTSDLPVAEEAAVIAEAFGHTVDRVWDVGVAGIHRVLKYRETLERASAVIVVAGMEGALASVVAGLVPCPVVAVPTSVGYGAAFHGLAALLGMLNACATGVAVVNIDNGFGAAMMAMRINEERP